MEECFSRFLNCANGTKSGNASHIERNDLRHRYKILKSAILTEFAIQNFDSGCNFTENWSQNIAFSN